MTPTSNNFLQQTNEFVEQFDEIMGMETTCRRSHRKRGNKAKGQREQAHHIGRCNTTERMNTNGIVEQFNEFMELTKRKNEIVERFDEIMGLLTNEITRGNAKGHREQSYRIDWQV